MHFTLDEPSYSPLVRHARRRSGGGAGPHEAPSPNSVLRGGALGIDARLATQAYICSLATVSVVILSCVTFVIETLPQYQTGCVAQAGGLRLHADRFVARPARRRAQSFFDHVEVFCIAFFTAEYGLRLLTAPALFSFVRRFANVADVAAILPFYIELIIRAGGHNDVGPDPGGYARARLVRIVRLVRLFRLVRISQRNEKLRVVVAALQESADMLAVLAFLLGIATVIGSTLMFYAEEGNDRMRRPGEPPVMAGPQFHSIPDAFWWCIVTFMTVGYGDVVPVGPEGQLVAALTMIVSFVVLALPISVIGANFTQQWIVYKETTLLTRRTGTLGAEFAELKAELEVHTGVLDEIVNVAHARAVAMEERGAAMRDAAARAGLGSVLHAPPSFDDSDEGKAARAQRRETQDQNSPARSVDTPRRSLVPRVVLGEAEAELELLLAELEQDAQAAGETFAMAELISSEDFLTRMDAAATKHHRLAAMDVKGNEACAAVHALLASLAADRAARPSLEAAAEATHVPGLAAAAAAAAALLASSGFSIGTSPPQPAQRSISFRERPRTASGGGGSEPRDLDAVSAAMRASQDSLDKLLAARREASVQRGASRTALDIDAI